MFLQFAPRNHCWGTRSSQINQAADQSVIESVSLLCEVWADWSVSHHSLWPHANTHIYRERNKPQHILSPPRCRALIPSSRSEEVGGRRRNMIKPWGSRRLSVVCVVCSSWWGQSTWHSVHLLKHSLPHSHPPTPRKMAVGHLFHHGRFKDLPCRVCRWIHPRPQYNVYE